MRKVIIIALVAMACNTEKKDNESAEKDMIQDVITQEIAWLSQQKDLSIEKTVYLNQNSEDKTIKNPNWQEEFTYLRQYSFNRIAKTGDILIDTIYDERTKRYLIRGMRASNGQGIQNMHLVLDSNRKVIQIQLAESEKNWMSEASKEVFWDKASGELNYSETSKTRFGKPKEIKILSHWGENE